ncbi:MAG: hypothetical protein ACM3JB_06040 [Acidobacteriaceae bacterium]
MTHVTQEQLVDHYYKDDADAAATATHLALCKACRADFDRLSATLDAVSTYDAPERNEEYGTEVWNRIRAHLPEPGKRSWLNWGGTRRSVAAGALAALIITAFFLGRITKPVQQLGPTVANGDKDKKVLLVALGDHLDRSQMILVELSHAPHTDDVDISSEKKRAEELLASNRLYRQAAIRNGDADIAAVLDELERVLVEVSHEPSKPDSAELREIQSRIQAKGILFKVRVIGSKVRSDETRPTKSVPTPGQTSRQTT